MVKQIKENIQFITLILGFAAVLCGYGIWIGTISNRLDVVEKRVVKVEEVYQKQVETLQKNIQELTIQSAVLSEKVQRLTEEIRNGNR